MPETQLKDIHCSNKNCRAVLGKTDGEIITPANEKVFSKLLTHKKKRRVPLYCASCHRITRFYKTKFNSKAKLKKAGDKPASK